MGLVNPGWRVGFWVGAPGGVRVGTRMVLEKVVGTFLLPLGFFGVLELRFWVLSIAFMIWVRLSWGLLAWAGTRVAFWLSEPTMSATFLELVMISGLKNLTGFWAISLGSQG